MAKEKNVVRSFIVLKQFTFDKVYYVGNTIELSNQRTIDNLLIQKYIK
jgi:hypothetical protein